MKLRDEASRSYIDSQLEYGIHRFLSWGGMDVAPSWSGAHMPATRSDDAGLVDLCRWNRSHYLFYRALLERYVDSEESTAVDVGCGTGARTALLARYLKKVDGIDMDGLKIFSAAQLQFGGDIAWIFGDILQSVPTSKYDYAFCVEVIEHVAPERQDEFISRLLAYATKKVLLTTPKDSVVERKPPHIGLWTEGDAARIAATYRAPLEYMSSRKIERGGVENPWCGRDEATHYVVAINAT